MDPFIIENWSRFLRPPLTSETIIEELPAEEATALRNATISRATKKEPPPENDQKLLARLAARIGSRIAGFPEGAIVKVSTRSAKDSCTDRAAEILRSMLRGPSAEELLRSTERKRRNVAASLCIRAMCSALRITSGEEAVSVLTTSDRVFSELGRVAGGLSPIPLSLVLRRWDQRIDPLMEVRCFVNDGELTAATQYWRRVFVPFLHEHKDEILSRIEGFFYECVQGVVPMKRYTLDLAVFAEKVLDPACPNADCMTVVEINHPVPQAGSGLWDLEKESDRRVVEQGPFDFRVVPRLPDNPISDLPQPLLSVLASELKIAP